MNKYHLATNRDATMMNLWANILLPKPTAEGQSPKNPPCSHSHHVTSYMTNLATNWFEMVSLLVYWPFAP